MKVGIFKTKTKAKTLKLKCVSSYHERW